MGSVTVSSEQTSSPQLTALVKGAGPSGLAAAVTLAHLGFNVTVTEKRPWRSYGAGRKNMVAIRPDTLRLLDDLGALKHLVEAEALTPMVGGHMVDQWDEAASFAWGPLMIRYPHRHGKNGYVEGQMDVPEYKAPNQLNEQLPSSYVDLGELEDALLKTGKDLGNVKVINEATIELIAGPTSEKYNAVLIEQVGSSHEQRTILDTAPDLIIGASGKNDTSLSHELNFSRLVGVTFDEDSVPAANSRLLKLSDEGALESQLYSVFAVKTPEQPMGLIEHTWRKDGTGTPPQPLCEIIMGHKGAEHLLLHLPRELDVKNDKAGLGRYVVERVNGNLGTTYTDLEDMRRQGVLVVGDPLQPVVVESSTAPTFVFGSNVVVIGDCAMCCSPASGIGADIGVHSDSLNVGRLGADLITTRKIEDVEERERVWKEALDMFNNRKAQSAVMWSQGSRKFYISGEESKGIVEQVNSQQSVAA